MCDTCCSGDVTSITSTQGPKGDTGSTGATGATGSAGATGAAGKGTLLISGYTGATAIAGDMYNAAAGYTWGSGITISGITGANTARITVSIEYTLSDVSVVTLYILLNGTPSTAVYNIRKVSDIAGFRTITVEGELSSLANNDVITFKAVATSAVTATLTNGYLAAQIFQ